MLRDSSRSIPHDNPRSFLLWSDVKKNRIYRWEEGGGLFTIGKSIYLEPSGCRTNATLCQALVEPGKPPREGAGGMDDADPSKCNI